MLSKSATEKETEKFGAQNKPLQTSVIDKKLGKKEGLKL